jgi:hypothetical protein
MRVVSRLKRSNGVLSGDDFDGSTIHATAPRRLFNCEGSEEILVSLISE